MKAVRWAGFALSSLGKERHLPRCFLVRLRGKKPSEPWRGAAHARGHSSHTRQPTTAPQPPHATAHTQGTPHTFELPVGHLLATSRDAAGETRTAHHAHTTATVTHSGSQLGRGGRATAGRTPSTGSAVPLPHTHTCRSLLGGDQDVARFPQKIGGWIPKVPFITFPHAHTHTDSRTPRSRRHTITAWP